MKSFWVRLKPREKYFAIATGAVAAACFFYRLAFVPALEKVEDLERDLLIQSKQLVAYQRAIAQREQIQKAYSRYQHLIQPLQSDAEETSRLLGEIAALARESSLTVVNLRPRPVETSGLVRWYQVELETEAFPEGITRFIYQIERSQKMLQVERLEIKRDEKAQNPLRCVLRISKIAIP
ncbi:MAG: hypothetical protein HY594_04090 [Candidatus Omnitrophica bacterium]|nr:hypothetical protein [Candidatus Omnitrophota bacterium]